jgi:hypothetical protein
MPAERRQKILSPASLNPLKRLIHLRLMKFSFSIPRVPTERAVMVGYRQVIGRKRAGRGALKLLERPAPRAAFDCRAMNGA